MARVGGKRAVGVSRDALRRQQEKRSQESAEGGGQKTRQALNEGDAAIKIYESAARLQGGPRDGRVYYVGELEEETRVGERIGVAFPYVRTRAHTTLPWTGGIKGEVWRYQADLDMTPPRPAHDGKCTRLGCEQRATVRLTLSIGGSRPTYACAEHLNGLRSAMSIGLSGATTGSAWVDELRISR